MTLKPDSIDHDPSPPLTRELLAVVAMGGFAMLIPGQASSSMLAIIGTVALVAASVWARWGDVADFPERLIRPAGLLVAILVAFSLWEHSNAEGDLVLRHYAVELVWSVPLLAVAAFIIVSVRRGERMSERAFVAGWIASMVVVVLVVAAQSLSANVSQVPYIDVLNMHIEAAKDLWSGLNPFNVTVVRDSNPYVPAESLIEGYFYTPLVLMVYSTSWKVLGDPRWVSAAAVAVFTLMILWPSRAWSRTTKLGTVAIAALFVANPSLEFVINRGWTEMLALPFLLGAAMQWKKNPLWSAVLLGIALSTKEYFIVLLPILLLIEDPDRWRRLMIAGGAVAMTYVPFAIADPSVVIPRATKLLSDVRPDSLGLAGYGVAVPVWLSFVVVLAAGVAVARRVDSRESLFLGFAAVMSVGFLMGPQAFVNYWLGLCGIVVVALHTRLTTADTRIGPLAGVPANTIP